MSICSVTKLILGETVTQNDIDIDLYEMCDDLHSSCWGNCCPIAEAIVSIIQREGLTLDNRELGIELYTRLDDVGCFKNPENMKKFMLENKEYFKEV